MEQITFNPNNEPYYSEDFIKGFKCGVQRQFEADKADRPQGEWIPCSERLPDEDGEYLVTQKNGSIGRYVFNYDGNSEEYFKRCATAWMPLPKPWKGADDE